MDPATLLQPLLGERAARWCQAICSVVLRDVGGRNQPVTFEPERIHEAESMHARRFCALMLMILEECRAGKAGIRASGRGLWRGRRDSWHVDADGEYKRRYVRAGHQGGLAARLGVCVKEVDRYLRVAIAAGFVNVWQVKKGVDKLPKKLRGHKYAFATFQWLQELPRAVTDRLRGLRRAHETETPPAELASAPRQPEADSPEGFFASVLAGFNRPPRAPD